MSIATTNTNTSSGEALLTEEALTKVTAIAFEEVPDGRILEIEIVPDAPATYEVHMLDADGVPMRVYIDKSFDYVGVG